MAPSYVGLSHAPCHGRLSSRRISGGGRPSRFPEFKGGCSRARTGRVGSQRIYSAFRILVIRPVERPIPFSLEWMESNTWCPRFDSGDDFVWLCGPGEGFGIMVGLRDEVAVDGGLEIDHSSEDTALQSLLGKVGEEPLDCVEPRARGRCRCRGSRAQTFWPAPAQGADELLVTMALHASGEASTHHVR